MRSVSKESQLAESSGNGREAIMAAKRLQETANPKMSTYTIFLLCVFAWFINKIDM